MITCKWNLVYGLDSGYTGNISDRLKNKINFWISIGVESRFWNFDLSQKQKSRIKQVNLYCGEVFSRSKM